MADYTGIKDDGVTAADGQEVAVAHARSTDDVATAADAQEVAVAHERRADDGATLGDAATVALSMERRADDSVAAVDTHGVDEVNVVATADAVTVADIPVMRQQHLRSNHDGVVASDGQQLSGSFPKMWMDRRIIIKNVSRDSVVIDAWDMATRGNLGSANYAATLRYLEELPIPFESYSTIAAAIKARYASMVRRGLLKVYDAAPSNATVVELSPGQVVTVS